MTKETISTSTKSMEKFRKCGIQMQKDYVDENGITWVAEYDSASPSGICWEILTK